MEDISTTQNFVNWREFIDETAKVNWPLTTLNYRSEELEFNSQAERIGGESNDFGDDSTKYSSDDILS